MGLGPPEDDEKHSYHPLLAVARVHRGHREMSYIGFDPSVSSVSSVVKVVFSTNLRITFRNREHREYTETQFYMGLRPTRRTIKKFLARSFQSFETQRPQRDPMVYDSL
jgi:hypothetical protein